MFVFEQAFVSSIFCMFSNEAEELKKIFWPAKEVAQPPFTCQKIQQLLEQTLFLETFGELFLLAHIPDWAWPDNLVSGVINVVSIEFSPLSSVELITSWYQLHNGDYKGISVKAGFLFCLYMIAY